MAANSSYLSKGIEIVRQACVADSEEKFEEAYNLYVSSLQYFMHALKWEKNDRLKASIRTKVEEYMARAEKLKAFLDGQEKDAPSGGVAVKKRKPKKGGSGGGGGDGGGGDDDDDSDPEQARLRGALASAILTEKPNVKWDDVAGLENAKEALKEAVILPMKFPQLFQGKRKPWKGILLYGPPGTGKSYLAKALANEADCTFFSVSSSDLVSKWMGESERLVRQLFEMARDAGRAIIFIDEVDSLCGSRSDNESESSRRIKTEFLVQMNGVGKDDDGILVAAATNTPMQIDSAMRRRFEKRIYIPLPELEARIRMFEIHIGNDPLVKLTPQDYRRLGELTEGYSGADIGIVTRDALMQPIRKVQTAKFFKELPNGKVTPCRPNDPAGSPMTWVDIEGEKLQEPDVIMDDFLHALETTRPTVSPEDLEMYEKFTADFGQEG
ncbi:uncharacterized protein AMSG_05584 [Thecamonas trahens ATCC 50062]|uniref:vesicle-fusing ATPase n=1 Tax=Thecamonas trahens ATCC 50062 TaxID=461836 RepID=A0A0L0DBT1_THETB|nr:hypothetical protein AMSG_05584 [Thecamonas trahens ATCC 50062]KNC49551.1 hypothetical protein AMSG_05584 [Thecamonas trahens ATCC 50062]|eukprot:XP_013757661.1 hypothetical protein AMSG_05584 [Thecamonas trahens ATCC 50062]